MQRYQRKRHRLMWVVLAVVTAVALFIAITKRPEIPTQNPPVRKG